MVNLSYNGIKNTIASFNLFSISINRGKNEGEIQLEEKEGKELHVANKIPEFMDNKTTLGGWNINLVNKISDDIIVYFFIQKEKSYSSWNLVAPVILEKSTGKIYQYGLGYFALEGCGGGLRNTKSIIYNLKRHMEKGFQVSIIPKVVDNALLRSFEYVDSGTRLSDLLEKSTDLISYRKDTFEMIYKQYQELLDKNGIEQTL